MPVRPDLPAPSRRHLLLGGAAWLGVGRLSAAERPLRVMLNDVAPYAGRQDHDLRGLHVSLMTAIALEAGMTFDYRLGLYARVARALSDRAADLVVTLMGPDQDARGVLVELLHPVRYLVLSRAEAAVHSLADLAGKRLGIARSAYYSAAINDDERVHKVEIVDPFQGLRMLALGRLDAVVSTDLLLAQALQQRQVSLQRFAPALDAGGGSYALYASRDLQADWVGRLRASIQRLQQQGQLAALVSPYQQLETVLAR